MFTKSEECTTHPWANLVAKAEGFKPVYAKYDATTKTLEVRWPPEGDAELFENISSFTKARQELASIVSKQSLFVFNENH